MNRRGFIGSILAAAAAPAIISGGVLMPIKVLRNSPLVLWGDGIHDDTAALQGVMDGKTVYQLDPMSGVLVKVANKSITNGQFRVSSTIVMGEGASIGGSPITRTGNDAGPYLEIRGDRNYVMNSIFEHESRKRLDSGLRIVA